MIVVQIDIFLVVCFNDWCIHGSRFKILRDPEHTFQREKKTEKRKEKAIEKAGAGRLTRFFEKILPDIGGWRFF